MRQANQSLSTAPKSRKWKRWRRTLFKKNSNSTRCRQCVQVEIDRLPESLRTVLFLSDVMEFSHREIAEVVGITVENVKVRLHRARKKLKELLEQKCTFETDERNVLVCEPKDKCSS